MRPSPSAQRGSTGRRSEDLHLEPPDELAVSRQRDRRPHPPVQAHGRRPAGRPGRARRLLARALPRARRAAAPPHRRQGRAPRRLIGQSPKRIRKSGGSPWCEPPSGPSSIWVRSRTQCPKEATDMKRPTILAALGTTLAELRRDRGARAGGASSATIGTTATLNLDGADDNVTVSVSGGLLVHGPRPAGSTAPRTGTAPRPATRPCRRTARSRRRQRRRRQRLADGAREEHRDRHRRRSTAKAATTF